MKLTFLRHIPVAAAVMAVALPFTSCQDDVSQIGNSIARGEVLISIDSVGFKLKGHSVATPVIDSRSTSFMLGSISIPEYGDLHCDFVSRLLSSSVLMIPDSIPADSITALRMALTVPMNGITGDSLAPQQMKVYELTKQLPDSIDNLFNPEGYYSQQSLLGTKSYTASVKALSDSVYNNVTKLTIDVDFPLDLGIKVFKEYRERPETFAWPQSFAKFFPGIYVDNSFGRGCIIGIDNIDVNLHYKYLGRERRRDPVDSVYKYFPKTIHESTRVFTSAPEVLSSNNIRLKPAPSVVAAVESGSVMVQSPAGYNASITFPADEIIAAYRSQATNLPVINSLTLRIPVEIPDNDFNIGASPYLLLIKSDQLEEFFAQNKVPDGKSAFYAPYSETNRSYTFSSLRSYIIDLMESGEPVEAADMTFTLVPVQITTELTSSNQTVTTSCVPYLERPTLFRLLTDEAEIKFTFTSEIID